MKRLERVKSKINDLVEVINMTYESKWIRKVMEVDFGCSCNVYIANKDLHEKLTAFHSLNYNEVRIRLDGYLMAL